jgi:hypothetical protein
MNDFYEKHKNSLFAVFLIVGTKKSEKLFVLCDQDKLEETKKGFDNITSTSIYSFHKNSTTIAQSLLNTDLGNKNELNTFSISIKNDKTL